MSYGIIRIQKMSKGLVKGIQIHDQREKDHSYTNLDIDFKKSTLNYDLHNPERINFNQVVKNKINQLNLKRAIRYDAVVMCQCLITSDKEFFNKMSDSEIREFFKNAYNFVCDKYGKDNVVSAIVHLDEMTPHIHVNFVPITSDGRLSARDFFSRKKLSNLQDEFYEYNKSKGYDLKRGESKEEKRRHLATEEYKIASKRQNIDAESVKLNELCNILDKSYKAKLGILDSFKAIDEIERKSKSTLSGQIKIDKQSFDILINLSKKAAVLEDETQRLKVDIDKYKSIANKSKSSVSEKLELYKTNEKLKNNVKELDNIIKNMYEFIKSKNLQEELVKIFKSSEKIKLKQSKNDLEL